MLCAVVPLMSGERLARFRRSVVLKLIAFSFWRAARAGALTWRCSRLVPSFAAIIGALNDLSEPATGLRRINPIRIHRRALQVIHLPSGKMRSADVPFLPLAIGRQNECAFPGSCQHSNFAHHALLKSCFREFVWRERSNDALYTLDDANARLNPSLHSCRFPQAYHASVGILEQRE